MIDKAKAFSAIYKLGNRIEKIIGEKKMDKLLSSRKGLGKTRGIKIFNYSLKKPKSTLRRVKKINTALDLAPSVAVGSSIVGIGALMSSKNKNNKKG
jgi:hypothetical protein